jgi:hypothetical protein
MKDSKSSEHTTMMLFSGFLEKASAYLRKRAANTSRYIREVIGGIAQPVAELKVSLIPKGRQSRTPDSRRHTT